MVNNPSLALETSTLDSPLRSSMLDIPTLSAPTVPRVLTGATTSPKHEVKAGIDIAAGPVLMFVTPCDTLNAYDLTSDGGSMRRDAIEDTMSAQGDEQLMGKQDCWGEEPECTLYNVGAISYGRQFSNGGRGR